MEACITAPGICVYINTKQNEDVFTLINCLEKWDRNTFGSHKSIWEIKKDLSKLLNDILDNGSRRRILNKYSFTVDGKHMKNRTDLFKKLSDGLHFITFMPIARNI